MIRFILLMMIALPVWAQGVDVGEASEFRKLVPAADLEKQANTQYHQLLRKAQSKKALVPATDPQTQRLRAIADRIIPFAPRFNGRARNWKWEINLIRSKQINAFCMPGGKIAFFTGLIDQLDLTDDEIAMVMGHEVAHALREHAREQMAKGQLTSLGASLLGALVSDGRYTDLFQVGGNLLTLKFSRDDESEADLVGMELAARAAYDPRAGITLWEKMGRASKGAPPEWFSTHPPGNDRIAEIRQHLPQVMPLYEEARHSR